MIIAIAWEGLILADGKLTNLVRPGRGRIRQIPVRGYQAAWGMPDDDRRALPAGTSNHGDAKERYSPHDFQASRALRESDRDARAQERRSRRRVQRGALSLPPRQRPDAAGALEGWRQDLEQAHGGAALERHAG